MKTHCLAFFKTSGSVVAVGLELRTFSQNKGLLFSTTVENFLYHTHREEYLLEYGHVQV